MGKTEISRRLAKLVRAPFVKVEASKFTEVGYVGRDVESIIRDLAEVSHNLVREEERVKVLEKAEEIAAIHRAVDALTRLVDNVVAIGKRDWLTQPTPTTNVDLAELCQQIWDEDMRGCDTHSLVVNEKGPRRPIKIDVAYLRTLLSNLFQNAVKYSPGHREVLANIIYQSRDVKIRVTDFGIGIPEEELPLIFEPFRRAKNAESISGSGLGLAIAQAAAKAMGCRLMVTSKEGEGTTFEVTFPKR